MATPISSNQGPPTQGVVQTLSKWRNRRGELEDALSKASEKRILYPLDLEKIDHWIALRVHEPKLLRVKDYPIKESKLDIFLPLAMSLGTQYGHDYSSEGIGAVGAAAANIADRIGKQIAERGAAVSTLHDTLKQAAGEVGFKDAKNAGVYYGVQALESGLAVAILTNLFGGVGGVTGIVGAQAVKGALGGAGVARNPYMAVLYESPKLRTHQFTWKFVPRSKEESNALQNLIFNLKYYAAPNINKHNKHFLDYPQQFDIDFHYEKYLFNIGPSVLTDIEVNYHAEGQPMYHDIKEEFSINGPNGREIKISQKAPVSIEIATTFQEVSIVTKESMRAYNR